MVARSPLRWQLVDKMCIVCMITSMDSGEVIARLRRDGWILVHVRGSHHQFKHPEKPGRVTLPHPKRDLPIGTLRNIFRQAGWEWPPR